jgi:hypothetical protein
VITMGLNDGQRLQECGQFLTFLYQGPVTAVVVMLVLLFVIGPAVFAGFIVLFLLIPLQRVIAKKVGKVRRCCVCQSCTDGCDVGLGVPSLRIDAKRYPLPRNARLS